MTRNSVVLVPFPFDDFSETKVRPALCLTEEIGNYDHVIIAFISSRIPDLLAESDIEVSQDSEDGRLCGFRVDSVIRLHKMVTIPKSLIKRRLGRISKSLEFVVQKRLANLFCIETK